MYAIETRHLSKQYGHFQALTDVNLSVPAGSIYGFIGLNGAGKTTTMRALLNMIKPTSGEALILGQNVTQVKADFWNNVGYLIETPQAYANLTTQENLEMYTQLRKIPKSERESRINTYLEALDLIDYRDKPVKELSLGNRQKIGLVKALIHHPKVLLLDEPTNGLDPQGLNQVRLLLKHLVHDEGTTILISSHILAEMEQMLTHIGILNHGAMVRQESYADFTRRMQLKTIATFQTSAEQSHAQLLLNDHGIGATVLDGQLIISQRDDVKAAITLLAEHTIIPTSWHPQVNRLEDYFLNLLDGEAPNHD